MNIYCIFQEEEKSIKFFCFDHLDKFEKDNKKYKVILMARVYIKGIREPENSNFWVLDPKNIRIYRILFKEIS